MSVSNTYKKLLLISEATFSESGTGINRTLINLFKDYPKDQLMIAAPQHALLNTPPAKEFERNVIGINPKKSLPSFKILPGRIKSWIFRKNFTLLGSSGVKELEQIRNFAPQVILLCTNSIECMLIAKSIKDSLNIPFYIYAMDDWRDLESTAWKNNSAKSLIHTLLKEANGWIMISDALEKNYSDRYKLSAKKAFIAHNPVEFNSDDFNMKDSKEEVSEDFKVAYAGAIWPMHYDALLCCAKAIKDLRNDGCKIQLKLYTSQMFWEDYKKDWLENEVLYGGFISYDQLRNQLSGADLLLTSSSFNEKYKHLSYTSVQTKLTDYMSAAKPILSIGPIKCACNEFVEKWDCGFVYPSNNIDGLRELLLWACRNRDILNTKGRNGYQAAKLQFSTTTVNPKLYAFLS